MKQLSLATLGLALLTTSASFAGTLPSAPQIAPQPVADSAGLFTGVDAGAFWIQKLSAGSPLGVETKFKTGWGIEVPFGYDFGNGLSVGISAGYDKANIDSITGSLGGSTQAAVASGSLAFVPLMANASYKIKLAGNLSWYIGGGLGAVQERGSFKSFDLPAIKTIVFGQLGATATFDELDTSRWDFGFEAFSGFSYQVCPAASIDLGYRYMRTNGSFSVNGESTGHFSTSLASLGFTWKF